MMGRAGMEEVLCWKMLRAAISQSFDLETLPDLVKTAGSANQMARTLCFQLLPPGFSFPIKINEILLLSEFEHPVKFLNR